MPRLTTILLSAAGLFGFLALGTAGASAQDKYPSRTVKILVPYAPGGATDITARVVGDQMQKITGQTVRRDQQAGRLRPAWRLTKW